MKPGRFLTILCVVTALCIGLYSPADAEEYKTHTVVSGDTLWGVSQKYYGDRTLWPKLWELNRNNVYNPHQLTIGDKLVIYPIDRLMLSQAPPSPPPIDHPKSLYDRGQPLDVEYPKYFTFVADADGIAGSGVTRIKVKKRDPLTGKVVVTYDEARQVGEVIASMERGYKPDYSRGYYHGKALLSFNDDIVVRFSEDVAKILDSETHEDPDPYFRQFPIYGMREDVLEADEERAEFAQKIGTLHEYKGLLTIVSRVETLATLTEGQKTQLRESKGRNLDVEPVSYIARITYSERPITIGDKIYLFKPLYPGPDREIGGRKLHEANQYNAPMTP